MCWPLPTVSSSNYAIACASMFAEVEVMLFYPNFLVSPFFPFKNRQRSLF